MEELSSLGAQQLGTLADLGLACQEVVEQSLRESISKFLLGIPKTIEAFKKGDYLRLVEDFDVDNFGARGDRYLLDELGILDGPPEFVREGAVLVVEYQRRHAETWWRSEGLLHQRVVSYAEYDLCRVGGDPLRGCRYQQNGYQGTRQSEERILPTPLPFNRNVDRSLCSENQLLASVCEDLVSGVSGHAHVALAQVRGWLRLFVTGAPCLSCIGAMRQFQLLLPAARLFVSIGDELQHDVAS